jgi:hypothetical protein
MGGNMNEFARQVMMWAFLLVVSLLLVKAVREAALRSRDI